MEGKIIDCHYCEWAACQDAKGWCDCYVEDFGYFSHSVKDSKKKLKIVLGLSFVIFFRRLKTCISLGEL